MGVYEWARGLTLLGICEQRCRGECVEETPSDYDCGKWSKRRLKEKGKKEKKKEIEADTHIANWLRRCTLDDP